MARIVIIDDDPSILGLMVQVCRQMGHEVVARGSGREGMAAVGEVRPELLLVDLKIPDMNGLEVIQECRREYPGTAVVMVTGFASVETAVEAMKLGAFDYLTKPFELDDLRRTVERALTQGRETGRAVVAETAGVVAAAVGWVGVWGVWAGPGLVWMGCGVFAAALLWGGRLLAASHQSSITVRRCW